MTELMWNLTTFSYRKMESYIIAEAGRVVRLQKREVVLDESGITGISGNNSVLVDFERDIMHEGKDEAGGGQTTFFITLAWRQPKVLGGRVAGEDKKDCIGEELTRW